MSAKNIVIITRARICLRVMAAFLVLGGTLLPAEAEPSLEHRYLEVYTQINEGEHLEKRGDLKAAMQSFGDSYAKLAAIQNSDPRWQSALVLARLRDLKLKLHDLQFKANSASGVIPAISPVKFDVVRGAAYPWKTNISTTMFWIGEGPTPIGTATNLGSAWNAGWVKSNHGLDSPYNRNGYAAGDHASTLNPFYVALPFNDLAHPDEARDYVPRNWAAGEKDGKPVSACQNRWVWIKSEAGKSCFAQWEDVGPGTDNNAEYVFGNGTVASDEPGLCVSPAVAQCLGLNGPAKTAWRFVDDGNVHPGPWLLLDEQAVLFSALHEPEK